MLHACHDRVRRSLDLLGRLCERVVQGRVDAAVHDAAADVLRYFDRAAPQHHEDEERHVFPRLLGSNDSETVQAVLRLQQDHHWMDVDWRELSPALAAIAADQGGYDVGALREGVEIYTALTHDHIALEESCIYPLARERFGSAELQQAAREMAERRRVRSARDAAEAS